MFGLSLIPKQIHGKKKQKHFGSLEIHLKMDNRK